jgi:hypothetical protein
MEHYLHGMLLVTEHKNHYNFKTNRSPTPVFETALKIIFVPKK